MSMRHVSFQESLLTDDSDTPFMLTAQGRDMQKKLWNETILEMAKVDLVIAEVLGR